MASISMFTTGDALNEIIWDFIKSGKFKNAVDVLSEGCDDKIHIMSYIRGCMKLVGDTNVGVELQICNNLEQANEDLFTGWCSWASFNNYEYYEFKNASESEDEDIKSLKEFFSLETLSILFKEKILNELGYEITKYEEIDEYPIDDDYKLKNGVILADGNFIECGFQQHQTLYPYLYGLYLSSSASWFDFDEDKVAHISNGQCSGKIGHIISRGYTKNDEKVNEKIISTLYKMRNHIFGFYGSSNKTIPSTLLENIIDESNNGSKFGGLEFLKRFTELKLPLYSRTPLDGKYCIRSSPNKSIGGLLTSHFDVDKLTHKNVVEKMESEFKIYENLVVNNKFNYFCQEVIDGMNGVANYDGKIFHIAISDIRGESVGGKIGVEVPNVVKFYIENILKELYKDFRQTTQIEFVFDGFDVYIVQLRTFWEHEIDMTIEIPEDSIKGNAFTRGECETTLEKCLVIESDFNEIIESKDLIGKDALIVKDNVSYSHALALSKSLRIPSIFGIGDVKLGNKIYINTKGKEAFIKTN